MTQTPLIGITLGDPVGIGPEIIVKVLADRRLYALCRPVVFGDVGRLETALKITGSKLVLNPVSHPAEGRHEPGWVDVLPLSDLPKDLVWGEPTALSGRAMVDYIERAASMAMAGEVHGVVTCPINKAAMHAAGVQFPGHTELLASLTGTSEVGMMLAGETLRVVLVTIHTALRNVPGLLSPERILATIHLTDRSLRERFGIAKPRIAVAALNPHAGEGGMFGDEEEKMIAPALAEAKGAGILVSGPHPPDTVFYHAAKGKYDAVVCMYHDQGLIPFKLLHFEDGVNTTLGLPIIRTSVDHGTAYDIAGTGTADSRSLAAAIRMAAEQARCFTSPSSGRT